MPSTEGVLLRTTAAACNDASRGQMLVAYLEQDLSPTEKADFEEHLRKCEHCDASVYNWRTIIKYMQANPQLRFPKRA